MLRLFTVIYPIGPDSFPGQPEGWCWTIRTNADFHQWKTGVINSMQYDDQASAESQLSMVLISIRRALVVAGVDYEVVAEVRADCPLNPDLSAELAQLL